MIAWPRLWASAWEGVQCRRLRSSLAALGLLVGVAAVVVMVSVGVGTKNRVLEQVTALGSNLITVRAGKSAPTGARASSVKEKASLTMADAAAIARLEGIVHAVPQVSKALRVGYQGTLTDTLMVAAPPEVFEVEGQQAAEGRFYSDREEKSSRRVAVVGASLRQHLAGEASLVGRFLDIKKQPFLVVGELAPKGLDPNGQDLDDRVYLPLKVALGRLLGSQRHVEFILVQTGGALPLAEARDEMARLLRQRHRIAERGGRDDFSIETQLEALQAQEESSRLFSSLIIGVAGISLLVAGIGIMAVMLIGVRERTPEIGVRRAVGARQGDILAQFLLEALILGLGGGLAGVACGLAVAWAVRLATGLVFSLPWAPAGLALMVSLAIAVVFGLWPARKAARLTVVEAVSQE